MERYVVFDNIGDFVGWFETLGMAEQTCEKLLMSGTQSPYSIYVRTETVVSITRVERIYEQ